MSRARSNLNLIPATLTGGVRNSATCQHFSRYTANMSPAPPPRWRYHPRWALLSPPAPPSPPPEQEPLRVLTPRIGCEDIGGSPEKKRRTENTRMVLCHAVCCWTEDDFGTFPQISVGMHIHGCTSETWKRLIVLAQKHKEVLVPLDI